MYIGKVYTSQAERARNERVAVGAAIRVSRDWLPSQPTECRSRDAPNMMCGTSVNRADRLARVGARQSALQASAESPLRFPLQFAEADFDLREAFEGISKLFGF